ncbi:acetyltransferas-like protein [Massariosphaeria phaeospora]|uniref:Acetyltransferas-like protein n=1 Tax=Massariosphaeria phaeospora TaxID=100035 RepID=A0A7C8MCK1_9PLEO|nr:acetyltransferas-like protein [Massariosphaeria phaeospora]
MPELKIHTHPATSPVLQSALTASLPYSINLVYRTRHANRTPDAHILATFPAAAENQDQTQPQCQQQDQQQEQEQIHHGQSNPPHCWAAAYFDRSMRPETELWIFASGEMPGHSRSGDESGLCGTCRAAVVSLLDYLSTLAEPPLHPENAAALALARRHEQEHPETGPEVRYPLSPGAYMRHLLLPGVVTLGACHHEIVRICHESGLVREEFPGLEAPVNKFLFKISNLPHRRELPEGLRWGQMREKDIAIVQSRTDIPRAKRTLLSMESVGVFEEETDQVVAWTFLGLDGALSTLHTEPAYRGKGIAKAVAAKLFREHVPGLADDEQGNAWAHADVYVGNAQSESVCKSLGGEAMWRIFWVRIDVTRAGNLAVREDRTM